MRVQLVSGIAIAAAFSHATVHAQSAQPGTDRTLPQTSASAGLTAMPEAQSAAGTGGGPIAAGSPDGGALGDIIVTAQRISQSAQKAAVPIQVIGGSEMLKAGVNSAAGLNRLVPSLTVVSQGSYNFFFVRGVGNFSTTSYSDTAVAFNYDGVYIARPSSVEGIFYDLERTEVLKGPQGTLYGRNATGGAVNVLPTQPKIGEFSGYAAGSYGNYNGYNAQGAINIPVGESTAMRIASTVTGHDAFLKDGTDDNRVQAVRGQIKSRPAPGLTVRVAADYAHQGGRGGGQDYVERFRYNPTLTNLPLGERFDVTPANIGLNEGVYSSASQAFRQQSFAGPAGRVLGALTPLPFQDNRFYGVEGEINYDTPIGAITIIPAYRVGHLDNLQGAGLAVKEIETDHQFSTEARIAKTGLGIFDYNIGVYYFDESISSQAGINQSAFAVYQQYRTGTKSYAGFGRLTIHPMEGLRLVGGIRYTDDVKHFNGNSTDLTLICVAPACPTTPLFQVFDSLSQIPFFIPPPGVPVVPGPGPGTIITRDDIPVDARRSFKKPTYRGAIEYDLTPRSLLYGSVETGFRSGGFSLATGYPTFSPEKITAFTIGSKNRFFDNRVQANIELFYWKNSDIQESHIGVDLAGHQSFFTQNIGKATLKGVEFDGRALVTPNTLLSVDIQYLDSKYTSFTYQVPTQGGPPYTTCAVAPASDPTLYNVDCSGKPAFNSPKWTVNLSAQQTFLLSDYKIVLSGDTQFRGHFYDGFEYAPYERVEAGWKSNAYLSLSPASDHWDITLFVRNIEGSRRPVYGTNAQFGGLAVVVPSDPRTFGVRLSAKF